MKNLKRDNFIWTIPPVLLLAMTCVAMLFESCMGGMPTPRQPVVTLETLQSSLDSAWKVYYLTLFFGAIFSAFIYYQVWKLTRKLRQLGHNV